MQGVLGYRPLVAGFAFLPVTLPNFAAAMMFPRLAPRFGIAVLAACGLGLSALGLAWLGLASTQSFYGSGVALPMVLIGIGQGLVLAPLTSAAVVGVASEDTGAASGMVNVAHQLGGSLGLAILIVVFAAAHPAGAKGAAALAHGVSSAMKGSALLVAAAMIVVLITFPRSAGARAGVPIPGGVAQVPEKSREALGRRARTVN